MDNSANSHSQSPSTPDRCLKLLCLGMPRTGTFSLQTALTQLGYKTYHFFHLIENPGDGRLWNRALDAKFHGKGEEFGPAEWDELLGDFQAITDIPAICFYDDLLRLNPNAKVILTRRAFDKWYPSIKSTVFYYLAPTSSLIRIFIDTLARLDADTGIVLPVGKKVLPFIGGNVSKEECRELYERHYEKIREMVPKEQLLEYEVGQGWGPLCEFLGAEVPQWEFPRINDTEWFRRKIRQMMWETARNVVFGNGVVAAAFATGLLLVAVWLGHDWTGHASV